MTGTALLFGGPRQRRPPDPGDGTSTTQAQEDPNTIKRPPLGSDQRCVEVLPVTTPSDAQGPTTTPSGTRPVASPPSSSSAPRTYAAALTSSSLAAERSSEGLSTIRQLKPDLPPDVLAKLSNTLEKDWNTSRKLQLSPELESLQAVALKESRVHSDYMLRERTPVETQALMAYFRGDLDLRHPPSFLKATMPVIQRAMVEQFHETHVEATLTADIPPQVPLRKGMTHLALFEELFSSNQNVRHGKEMIDRMMRDVKMLYFDGNHTLNFVFHSRRTAEFYNGISLRLQRVVIDLEDSSGLEDGAYNSAQLRRFYSIRVLNAADLGIATLVSAFSQLTGAWRRTTARRSYEGGR
ncbi:uncharacterized protein IUM83_03737 [Phytophthora cinnamomi]|uniref:uncharacterized protein n=1 Tax=Phytophthora cinnamomi TaxID=4785 RepID=UPI0035598AA3|nr:hypothetical protein IUM83_03737 [Phytophthora cinnamomi]